MRIVHVVPTTTPVPHDRGGALQRRGVELAAEQAMRGHEVTIFSAGGVSGSFGNPAVAIEALRVRSGRPLRDLEYLFAVRKALRRRGGTDVIHAHGAVEAARWLRDVAAATVLSVDFFRFRYSDTRLGFRHYRGSLNRFSFLLPVSEFCRDAFGSFYPSIRRPVVVVPNGVNHTRFFPDAAEMARVRSTYRLPDGPVVEYVGRVCEQKGSDLLLPLARRIAETIPGTTLVVAGPADEFGRVGGNTIVDGFGPASIRYLGAVPDADLRGLYSLADVLVLPTRRDEMFGMVVAEAAACGTPCVASDLGGIPEAAGGGGILVPVGDVGAMCAAVERVLSDPDLRTSLSRRAVEHSARFSWPVVADRLDEVYRSCVT